ncbi:curlin [Devosia sediminis]|uniref:Curlin n=1 Tax=Devosia sediminis TaxID=2798801 RepID=A0A934MKA1_9HYPH|nr:curlin [Devosia sediminis]MBJ3783915.1 curlin [Devosia sediminis]
MTIRFTRTIAAAFTAALIATSAGPAMAAGQIAIGFSPTDPDQAQALGLGLQVFSLVQGLSANGANVHQNGNGNSAGGSQNGSGNHGLIWQEGDGHNGTIHQNGNNNNCGLFQFGKTSNAQCVQNGNNQSGITTVFGF